MKATLLPSPILWIVVIRFRSELKGISSILGFLSLVSVGCRPDLAAATSRAPSVGSPVMPVPRLFLARWASLQSAPIRVGMGIPQLVRHSIRAGNHRAMGAKEVVSALAGGLREDEDIFASVWKSVQNRWAWLAINLITAFVASRVIGLFEGSIAKLVALAALMPIIAGIGGNSGNQTITMIVRALALGQITRENAGKLFAKELSVSALNGLIWGGVVGIFAFLIYHNWQLGLVMMMAMVLNLLLAASMGVLIPMAMDKLGRDPAVGSSVLITAITDSGGFFIFLGLATLFLV